MTHEAKESKWVQREVTLADNWEKPAFPILLRGENWEIYVNTQFKDVRNGQLPDVRFFDTLARVIPRKPQQGEDVTEKSINTISYDTEMLRIIAEPPPRDKNDPHDIVPSYYTTSSAGTPLDAVLESAPTFRRAVLAKLGRLNCGVYVAVASFVVVAIALLLLSRSFLEDVTLSQTAIATIIVPDINTPTPTSTPTERSSPTPVPTYTDTSTPAPNPTNTVPPTMTHTLTPIPSVAIVIVQSAILRTGPGFVYDQVDGVVQGDRLLIIGQSPDSEWLLVDPPNINLNRWIAVSLVEIEPTDASISVVPLELIPPTPPPNSTLTPTAYAQLRVSINSGDVREGPGLNYEAFGFVQEGEILVIYGTSQALDGSGIWYDIKTPAGIRGWVAGSILDLSTLPTYIPTVVETFIPPTPISVNTQTPIRTPPPSTPISTCTSVNISNIDNVRVGQILFIVAQVTGPYDAQANRHRYFVRFELTGPENQTHQEDLPVYNFPGDTGDQNHDWTPTQAGNYTMTVTVFDNEHGYAQCAQASRSFTVSQ